MEMADRDDVYRVVVNPEDGAMRWLSAQTKKDAAVGVPPRVHSMFSNQRVSLGIIGQFSNGRFKFFDPARGL